MAVIGFLVAFTYMQIVRPADATEYFSHSSKRGNDRSKRESDGRTIGELALMMKSGKQSDGENRVGSRTSYLVANAGDALLAGQALGADVLIVDPPRKGLDGQVLNELCKQYNSRQPSVESTTLLALEDEKVNWVNDVTTIIYVSCGFDALAHDCEQLLSSKAGWMLESAHGYVLFPGSDHVETICVFRRARTKFQVKRAHQIRSSRI